MNKLLTKAALLSFSLTGLLVAAPITITEFAGDKDFGANRDAYDVSTNMDYFVFAAGTGINEPATNSLGWIAWNYELPNEIDYAISGQMEVRSWDIDPADQMDVFFNFGGALGRVHAGELIGSNGGNVTTWENAVANGTTAALSGWTTTIFTLDAAAIDALSNSSGFFLELDVQNNATASWAAVIDYADLTLTYEPGAPNPGSDPSAVPEPTSMALFGIGGLLLGFARRRKKA